MNEMFFSFLNFRPGQTFIICDFVMAVVAENDEVVILVVRPVAVNVMLRKNVNSLCTTNGT